MSAGLEWVFAGVAILACLVSGWFALFAGRERTLNAAKAQESDPDSRQGEPGAVA